jgi:hypothetical protein
MIDGHEHDWTLDYGDAHARHYRCVGCRGRRTIPKNPAEPVVTETDIPQVGDRTTLSYGHEHYPGKSGIITAIREPDAKIGTRMVRVTLDPVWVMEDELRGRDTPTP